MNTNQNYFLNLISCEIYKTPEGRHGGIIILLQNKKYKDGVCEIFDPLSDKSSFDEEQLIQLNSRGPKGFKHLEKLKEGDTLDAYVYDPEAFGFLMPHECRIKVSAIEEDKWDAHLRHIQLEIVQWDLEDRIFNIERKPVVRTLKYVDL